jgi:pimeloyl-ACP methyl ester carboxylesterase
MVLANGTAKRPLETLFHSNALQGGFKILKKAYDKSPTLVRKIWRTQKSNPLSNALVWLGGFNPYLTPKEDVDLYLKEISEMDPGIFIHLIHNYDTYDATAWLHNVGVPTLILAGEKDLIIPLNQQELMHQLIPSSQLEVIRHGSHCPQMDLPELFNQYIEKFLEKNYPRS